MSAPTITSPLVSVLLQTECVLVLYNLEAPLIDHISNWATGRGSFFRGLLSLADPSPDRLGPVRYESGCTVGVSTTSFVPEVGEALSLMPHGKQIVVVGGVNQTATSKYMAIRKRFDRPLLVVSEMSETSAEASLVCTEGADLDIRDEDSEPSFEIRNIDTFRNHAWRVLLGKKLQQDTLASICNWNQPPMRNKHLVSMTHSSPPNVFFNGDPRISSGVEVEVADVIAQRMGFKAEHFYARFHFSTGKGNTSRGALQDVSEGRADLTLNGPLIPGLGDGTFGGGLRLSATDFLTEYKSGYMVPRPGELPPWANLFLAFDGATWILLWGSLVLMAGVFSLMYLTTGVFAWEKLLESITLPYAILFQEFHHVHMMDESPPYYDRLGVASTLRRLWVICSFLLVISFAGNLKATSVVKTFEDPTDSVQKIRERGLTVLMSSDFYFFTVRTTKSLQATADTPVLETHREMSKIAEETNGIYSLQELHYQDAYHLAGRNGSVVLATHRLHNFLRTKYLERGQEPPLVLLPYWDVYYQGFYTAYGSTLVEYLNPILREIVDFGIRDKFVRKYSNSNGGKESLGISIKSADREKMRLAFLVYPFGFAAVSSALAAAVFFAEIRIYRWKKENSRRKRDSLQMEEIPKE